MTGDPDDRVRRTEIAISTVLRVGVLSSVGLVLAGTLLTYAHQPELLSDGASLPAADFPHTLPAILGGLAQGSGRAWTMLGLLLLIATPIVRVAISIFAFAFQRDRVFVVLTSAVLAILLASLALGRVAG